MFSASGFSASVGTATGRIVLDISQLQQAAQMARQIGQQMDRAFAGIDAGARRGGLGFRTLADGVGKLRGELAALSLASGATTGLGLNAARDFRNYTIAFRQFVGTQQEAEKLTNRLIEQAGKYGLEWRGVLELSRALAPNLEDGVDGLDRMISQAARLRSIFPTAVRGSETIALAEFVAGQTTSLQRRFNINPDVINAAKEQFADVNEQLEYILDRYGATEEAALEMADAFTGVRNEVQLLLGEGFRPLFEQLRPILQQFREMLAATRQVHPGLLQFAAGMTAITAVTAPALLL
ncbi:MAG: hypothetical protein KDE31_08745, partial [Caldilineaceae bacterium]|nr:hypothetical protein [Caldilineaceae bacterium]